MLVWDGSVPAVMWCCWNSEQMNLQSSMRPLRNSAWRSEGTLVQTDTTWDHENDSIYMWNERSGWVLVMKHCRWALCITLIVVKWINVNVTCCESGDLAWLLYIVWCCTFKACGRFRGALSAEEQTAGLNAGAGRWGLVFNPELTQFG